MVTLIRCYLMMVYRTPLDRQSGLVVLTRLTKYCK